MTVRERFDEMRESMENQKRMVYGIRNNGDRIREMSNEELARYLYIESDRRSEEEWLAWLNNEVLVFEVKTHVHGKTDAE